MNGLLAAHLSRYMNCEHTQSEKVLAISRGECIINFTFLNCRCIHSHVHYEFVYHIKACRWKLSPLEISYHPKTDNDKTIYCLKIPSNICLATTYCQSSQKVRQYIPEHKKNQSNKLLCKHEGFQILPVSILLKKKSLVVHLSMSASSSLWIPHWGLGLAFIRWISNLACRRIQWNKQS